MHRYIKFICLLCCALFLITACQSGISVSEANVYTVDRPAESNTNAERKLHGSIVTEQSKTFDTYVDLSVSVAPCSLSDLFGDDLDTKITKERALYYEVYPETKAFPMHLYVGNSEREEIDLTNFVSLKAEFATLSKDEYVGFLGRYRDDGTAYYSLKLTLYYGTKSTVCYIAICTEKYLSEHEIALRESGYVFDYGLYNVIIVANDILDLRS